MLACSAILVPLARGPAAQIAAVQDAVDAFYPADRLSPSGPTERTSCYRILETSPGGDPMVVIAGYTDRRNGAIRLLQRNEAGEFAVAYDNPSTWMLAGARCAVRLQDVDFDGRPEALVNFQGVRASAGWMFAWDGSALTNLTPTRTDDGQTASRWLGPVAYDLEHKDSLRVIASVDVPRNAPGERPVNPAFAYRLGPSGYEVEKSVLAVMGFRADVDPAGNLRAFRLVQDSFPPYTLRVINGDREGRNRVDGATILVNEVEVAGPDQVNANTEFTTVVLSSLLTENHVTVSLTGSPEAQIIVLVEDSTRRSP